MATCPIVTVANAIAAELLTARQANTFGIGFEFTPAVLWANRQIELEDRDELRVDVAPVRWTQELKARGSWRWTLNFHLGVRQRFDAVDQDEDTGDVDDAAVITLVNLVSDLCSFFMPVAPNHNGRILTAVPTANWRQEDGDVTPITIDWDSLLTRHQFTGYFPLTYEISQASA